MSQLLADHHSEEQGDYYLDASEKFVRLAEDIGHFVKDTGGPHRPA